MRSTLFLFLGLLSFILISYSSFSIVKNTNVEKQKREMLLMKNRQFVKDESSIGSKSNVASQQSKTKSGEKFKSLAHSKKIVELQNNSSGAACFISDDKFLNASIAFSNKSSILENNKSLFLVKTTVFEAI